MTNQTIITQPNNNKKEEAFIETNSNGINPLASPSAGAPALKYGDVNTVTPSPGEVNGLIKILVKHFIVYF